LVLCVFTVDSSADDELPPTDMDWEQLLAATFDPADAMLLGPDDMFSLNRNDLLYAQKYAAAKTGTAAAPPTTGDHALRDDDLERCANDLDRFVNDLELACANIGHRDADGEVVQSMSNANGHDLDPVHGHLDNFDLDKIQHKSSHSDMTAAGDHDVDNDSTQGHTTVVDFYEGRDKLQPANDIANDLGGCEGDLKDDLQTKNCLQNSDEKLYQREGSSEEVSRQRRVLSDLDGDPDDPNDLEVTNGPDIVLRDMTDDLAAVHRYPYDPDPEATVV